jgi:DNA-binding MarR family transcriptional regulator
VLKYGDCILNKLGLIMPIKYIFTDPKMQIWMTFRQTSDSLAICEERQFAPFAPLDFTPHQHTILMAIKYSHTPLNKTQIADRVDRHPNSITPILDRMEKSGLVKRVRDNRDRRSFYLKMTTKGEKYFQKSERVVSKMIQELLDCLSDKELQTLQDLLEKIRIKVIDKYYDKKNITEVKVRSRSVIES